MKRRPTAMGCQVAPVAASIIIWASLASFLFAQQSNLLSFDSGGADPAATASSCRSLTTCDACIQNVKGCFWCSDNITATHCKPISEYGVGGDSGGSSCADTQLHPPRRFLDSSTLISKNESYRDYSTEADAIQMQPQSIRLSLRPGRLDHSVDIKFKRAKNSPIDLYFLIDLSASMKEPKRQLINSTGDILALFTGTGGGDSQQRLTDNFRIGFGAYNDKSLAPFAITTKERLRDPCLKEKDECMPAFNFKSYLPLQRSNKLFNKILSFTNVTGNSDRPESTLDALVQIALCNEEIGWRQDSRKVVLVMTNANFHIAGDGKLAGLIEPLDTSRCLLLDSSLSPNSDPKDADIRAMLSEDDSIGSNTIWEYGYDEERRPRPYDYPSVGQLHDVLSEKDINVIFAIKNDGGPDSDFNDGLLHEELSKLLVSAGTAELTNNGENIVKLLETMYTKIDSTVAFKVENDNEESVQVKVKAICPPSSTTCSCEDVKCTGVTHDDQLTFTVNVIVLKCGAKKEGTLYLNAGGKERVKIEYEVACSCDCGDDTPLSPICNGKGVLKCGVCECSEESSGQFCQCDGQDKDDLGCRLDGNKNNPICSNRGDCECGKCVNCGNRQGPFCECNKASCGIFDGEVCGGLNRGKCDCSQCVCESDYTGYNCACDSRETQCSSGEGEVCSGRGRCVCNSCRCNPGYRGKLCDDCPECKNLCVADNHRCAACAWRATSDSAASTAASREEGDEAEEAAAAASSEEDCAACEEKLFHVVDELPAETENTRTCQFSPAGEDACSIFYSYVYADDVQEKDINFYVRMKKRCKEEVPLWYILLPIVCAVVIFGLLVALCWKLYAVWTDRREMARFEKEIDLARNQVQKNPLFKSNVQTIQNPTFQNNNTTNL